MTGAEAAALVRDLAYTYLLHFVDVDDETEPGAGALSWMEGRRVMLVPLCSERAGLEPGLVLVDVIDDHFVVAASIDTTSNPAILIGDGERLDGPAELDGWVAQVERHGGLLVVDDDALEEALDMWRETPPTV